MRSESVSSKSTSAPDEESSFRVLTLQAVVTLIFLLAYAAFEGVTKSIAAFVGGLVYLLPTFVLTWVAFRVLKKRTAKEVAVVIFVGEFVKLLFCAAIIAVTIVRWPQMMWPLLIGFLVAQVGSWLAPAFNKKTAS